MYTALLYERPVDMCSCALCKLNAPLYQLEIHFNQVYLLESLKNCDCKSKKKLRLQGVSFQTSITTERSVQPGGTISFGTRGLQPECPFPLPLQALFQEHRLTGLFSVETKKKSPEDIKSPFLLGQNKHKPFFCRDKNLSWIICKVKYSKKIRVKMPVP